MATKRQEQYGNSSISMLKGEERVRKRPAVIFGSDDLEGCKHAVFEILSNAIDEAREGHGDTIIVTRYEDLSVEVEDFGRGCPVDYNEKEKRYNWELVFCEMYAGGKYGENGENYEYSLGLNGLGSCATQYASEFFDATIRRDGFRYDLHFEKGRNKGGLKKTETDRAVRPLHCVDITVLENFVTGSANGSVGENIGGVNEIQVGFDIRKSDGELRTAQDKTLGSPGLHLLHLSEGGAQIRIHFPGFDALVDNVHEDLFAVFPAAAALQLLAYYTSDAKGLNVDKPRNLAKSVTVE